MSATIVPAERRAAPGVGAIVGHRLARRLVHAQLRRLTEGELTLVEGRQRYVFGRVIDDFPVRATVVVRHPRFFTDIALGGSVGVGESYVHGDWSCDDLTAAVRIMVRNRGVLEGMERGLARLVVPVRKSVHWLRRNTRRGARRNIAAHYDLGNDLFRLFLDETMMYSSAIFRDRQTSLEEASTEKIERICRKIELSSADHVLEIGTGWGGFALHAASRYGCHVTTTTLSPAQFDLASQRVARAGLSDRVTVLKQDYRDLTGQYDKLVSIEMIEAIGHTQYPTFFRKCGDLLKPDGQMLLQAITIADQFYDAARKEIDFIKRHIFPGSCLPSLTALMQALSKSSDLRLFHLEDIGPHYARTLRHWRRRFLRHRSAVRALGYPDTFVRMWEFYLCYCEGGFEERAIGDLQLLLTGPLSRRASLLPSLPPGSSGSD